jgi:soluble lytic murein transglycosylase-like protein
MVRPSHWAAALHMAAALTLGVPAIEAEEVDPNLVRALRQAVEDQTSFDDNLDALIWLADMSKRLQPVVPDPYYRVSLLKSIHAEATRAGLSPSLVLAVIEVESSFDRFAVSRSGARGLMQVMPFWKKEIGHPRDDLFYPPTNLRYGCTILRYYMDRFGDELESALAQYNGSLGLQTGYPTRVLSALDAQWQPARTTRK